MSPAYLHKLFYFCNLGPVSPYFPKKKRGPLKIGNRCAADFLCNSSLASLNSLLK